VAAHKEIQHNRPGMTLSDSIYNTCVIDTFVAVPDAHYIKVISKLFVCLFSWRYHPLWLYFAQPGSGL
jgi:hypothetical protein